jgi:hypothetical protein
MLRFLGFLVVLAFVVLVIGLMSGWFRFTTVDNGGESEVRVTVDKDKVEEDVEQAKDTAKDLTGIDEERAQAERREPGLEAEDPSAKVVGSVVRVDLEARQLEVRPEGETAPVTFSVPEGADLLLNTEQAALEDLRIEDQVAVAWEQREEGRVAKRITATRS